MISVEEAKAKLLNSTRILPAVKLDIAKSLGYVLAEDIYSGFDIPQFHQSAMDGLAVCFDDVIGEGEIAFRIIGEVRAGENAAYKLENFTAVRIYTGAPIPENTTCVVMQELVEVVDDNSIVIHTAELVAGSNIRRMGSQIKKNELALSKGFILNPPAIGFLCSLGFTQVGVFQKPKVAVIATGNELRRPGEKLLPGQIFESNSFTIDAALQQTGFSSFRIHLVADDKQLLLDTLKNDFADCDVVIISGGISVGKYDLVKETLEELGVKEIFYKVAQKPGKPVYVGKKEALTLFALPGNPASSLVCFYQYVLPSLKKMSGFGEYHLKKIFLPLAESFVAKGSRSLFLKAKAGEAEVTILDGQESNMLRSFAKSNAMVYIPDPNRTLPKGEKVEVHLLPGN